MLPLDSSAVWTERFSDPPVLSTLAPFTTLPLWSTMP